MREWLFGLAVVAALFGATFWFWHQGEVLMPDGGSVSLTSVQGKVEVVSKGSADWHVAKQDDRLQIGDTVRTAPGAEATVSFFGLGEARLDESSSLVLREASRPYAFGSGMSIDLDPQGRVWNHVQKLYDPESGYRVHWGQVQASVRGTSFDMQVSAATSAISVVDSAVEIDPAYGEQAVTSSEGIVVLSEGSRREFCQKAGRCGTRPLTEDEKQSAWFISNMSLDDRFDGEVRKELRDLASSLGQRPLDGFIAPLVGWSERLHVWMAKPDEGPRLAAMQSLRRLVAMKDLADSSRIGMALEAWDGLHKDILAQATGKDGSAYAAAIRHALQDGMTLLADVLPSSAAYPLKLKVEEAYIDICSPDPVEYQHARLIGIDARLDEADKLIGVSSLDEAGNALDAAKQGITNVQREVEHLPESISEARKHLVLIKLSVVQAREASLRIRLATALEPPTGQMGTDMATTTEMLMQDAVTSTPVATSTKVKIVPTPIPAPAATTTTTTTPL